MYIRASYTGGWTSKGLRIGLGLGLGRAFWGSKCVFFSHFFQWERAESAATNGNAKGEYREGGVNPLS